MGINAPLSEGHNCFGENEPRRFNPDSREVPNPGKGRLYLVEGHAANADQQVETFKIKPTKPVEESPQAITVVEKPEDRGHSEVEIALRTPPPEYLFRVGDVY